jgi:hypothetical protein
MKNNIAFFEASAKEGTNVDEAFSNVLSAALKREREREKLYDDIPYQIRASDANRNDADKNSRDIFSASQEGPKIKSCAC